MSFNALGQYTPNHKAWDHVGNIIPDVENSEGDRPHLGDKARPASWLPVQFYDKHYENWNVVMPGKAVAYDPDGYLMPAEYGLTGSGDAPAKHHSHDRRTQPLRGTGSGVTGLPSGISHGCDGRARHREHCRVARRSLPSNA